MGVFARGLLATGPPQEPSETDSCICESLPNLWAAFQPAVLSLALSTRPFYGQNLLYEWILQPYPFKRNSLLGHLLYRVAFYWGRRSFGLRAVERILKRGQQLAGWFHSREESKKGGSDVLFLGTKSNFSTECLPGPLTSGSYSVLLQPCHHCALVLSPNSSSLRIPGGTLCRDTHRTVLLKEKVSPQH